uniref:DUF569 domain-containing protein n=1 Tax=Leersia perrieri TaxID=77586 RepID=A0A0D9VYB9_9ORYZ
MPLVSISSGRLFDTVQETHAMWRTFQRFDGDSDVLLLNEISPTGLVRALRANGRYSRWHRRVSQQPIDRYEPRFSSMMVWEVQVIPMSVQRPPYQLRNAARCLCFGQRRQGTGRIQVSVRVANHEGNYNDPREATFSLPGTGRSLIELERRFGCFNNDQPVSIFIRAGTHGQLFPLLTDLPSGLGNFKLVVFRAGTPGHDRLRFPDILAA